MVSIVPQGGFRKTTATPVICCELSINKRTQILQNSYKIIQSWEEFFPFQGSLQDYVKC